MRMSKPRARRATACPMRPMPTMPSVRPLGWIPRLSGMPNGLRQPSRMMARYSAPRRQAARISRKARSAVLSVSTSGVLVTMSPRAFAAATSMWSVPALGLAMIRTLSGNAASFSPVRRTLGPLKMASLPCSAAARMAASASRSASASTASNSRWARSATAGGTRRATSRRNRLPGTVRLGRTCTCDMSFLLKTQVGTEPGLSSAPARTARAHGPTVSGYAISMRCSRPSSTA